MGVEEINHFRPYNIGRFRGPAEVRLSHYEDWRVGIVETIEASKELQHVIHRLNPGQEMTKYITQRAGETLSQLADMISKYLTKVGWSSDKEIYERQKWHVMLMKNQHLWPSSIVEIDFSCFGPSNLKLRDRTENYFGHEYAAFTHVIAAASRVYRATQFYELYQCEFRKQNPRSSGASQKEILNTIKIRQTKKRSKNSTLLGGIFQFWQRGRSSRQIVVLDGVSAFNTAQR